MTYPSPPSPSLSHLPSLHSLSSLPQFLTVKVDEYLRRLRDGQLWGGEVELVVFSKMYRRSIVVFNQQENQVQEQIFYSPEDEAAGKTPEDLIDPVSGSTVQFPPRQNSEKIFKNSHKPHTWDDPCSIQTVVAVITADIFGVFGW